MNLCLNFDLNCGTEDTSPDCVAIVIGLSNAIWLRRHWILAHVFVGIGFVDWLMECWDSIIVWIWFLFIGRWFIVGIGIWFSVGSPCILCRQTLQAASSPDFIIARPFVIGMGFELRVELYFRLFASSSSPYGMTLTSGAELSLCESCCPGLSCSCSSISLFR